MDKYLAKQMKDEMYAAIKAIECDNGCNLRKGMINKSTDTLLYKACCEDFNKKVKKVLYPIRRKYLS